MTDKCDCSCHKEFGAVLHCLGCGHHNEPDFNG